MGPSGKRDAVDPHSFQPRSSGQSPRQPATGSPSYPVSVSRKRRVSDSWRLSSSGSARRRGGGRALASAHCAKYRPTVPRAATKSDTRKSHCTSPSHEPMLTAHTRRARLYFPEQPRPQGARSRRVATQDIRRDRGTQSLGPGRPRQLGGRRGEISAPN